MQLRFFTIPMLMPEPAARRELNQCLGEIEWFALPQAEGMARL